MDQTNTDRRHFSRDYYPTIAELVYVDEEGFIKATHSLGRSFVQEGRSFVSPKRGDKPTPRKRQNDHWFNGIFTC